MIQITAYDEYVAVRFKAPLAVYDILEGDTLDVKCIKLRPNTDNYQVYTYRRTDKAFMTTGTQEQILQRIEFLEKKKINTR